MSKWQSPRDDIGQLKGARTFGIFTCEVEILNRRTFWKSERNDKEYGYKMLVQI